MDGLFDRKYMCINIGTSTIGTVFLDLGSSFLLI